MSQTEHPDWSSKTYLVIDDFSIVHRMMRDMLRKLGAQAIDTIKNGPDAIELLKQKQYDVVLCDYNFSEGPNGQQILEEVRHLDLLGLTTIWIMVSSEKAVETVMGAAEQVPDGYILKPLTESLLLARLNRAWDQKQAFKAIDRAYAAKDYRKAAALCDQRLATDRIHAADLLRMKAGLLMKCGELAQARKVFEQALAVRDQVWAKAGLARIHVMNGAYEAAKALLLEVIRESPSYLDAYDLLAQTLQQAGEMEQALNILEMAARLSPYSVIRQKNLGEVALNLGRIDVAENAFRMSVEVGEHSVMKTPDAYLGLARICGMKNCPDEALQLLDVVRQNFEGEQVRLRAAITESRIYADNGQLDKAQQAAKEVRRHLAETNERLGTDVSLELAQLLSATGEAKLDTVATTAESAPKPDDIDFFNLLPAVSATSPAESPAARPAPAPASVPPVPQPSDEKLPANLLAMYNRAQVLIQYMQRNGYNKVSADEVRAVLSRAERLAPGHPRAQQVLASLHSLATRRS